MYATEKLFSIELFQFDLLNDYSKPFKGLYPLIVRPHIISASIIDNILTSQVNATMASDLNVDDLTDSLPILWKEENFIII